MSQVQSGSKSRFQTQKERVEVFLRDFEWTWTTAILFSLGFVFFLLIFAVVLPSFWLYLAEQSFGWGGPTDLESFINEPFGPEGYTQLRDAVAMGLSTGPIITALVVAAFLQNWRKRLRGAGGDTRPTGGYR